MMHGNGLATMLVVLFVAGLTHCATAGEGGDDPRIGWSEDFDDIAAWQKVLNNPHHGSPVKSVKSGDGTIEIVTQCGALNVNTKKDNWPEWPKKPMSSFTNFQVKYPGVTVDFDKYPYMVVRIKEKGCFFYLSVNGNQTKVAYTTGIHSQDMRTLKLRGKRDLSIGGQFLNTSGKVTIDYIRFVTELTDEEKAGFIDEGVTVRDEKLKGHPYHKLEQLNARAGRPIRDSVTGGEWCVYRDVATGAEMWRMTQSPANENGASFNCDGSAFSLKGRSGRGFHVYDLTTGKMTLVKGGLGDAKPRFSTTDPSMIVMAENKNLANRVRRLSIHYLNFRTGEKTEVAAFKTRAPWIVQELSSSPVSSKLVFGFRETNICFIIDPDIEDFDRRCKEVKLPTRLKGIRLVNGDKELCWYNCYTYEPRIMDLATGKTVIGCGPAAGGHSAGGPLKTVSPYGQMMKILVKNGLHQQTEETSGDIRIFANYKKPVVVDYGHVSANGKWVVTNGTRGDLNYQHVMISTSDPATVLRTTHYNTSRNDWVTNTYSRSSPDVTKVAYVSDQFDDGDIYIAVTGRPAPPTEIEAHPGAHGVQLTWKAPEGVKELAGYRVYRSARSGFGFVPLNTELITDTKWTDAKALAASAFYLVAAVEPSGIEGDFSNEAWCMPRGAGRTPRTFFIEAENCERKLPLRLALKGEASGTRYVRFHKAASAEPVEGLLSIAPADRGDTYALWLRCRAEAGAGEWELTRDGRPVGKAAVSGRSFKWVKSSLDLDYRLRRLPTYALATSFDGLALDKIAISSDPGFDPVRMTLGAAGPVTAGPSPVTGLKAVYVKPQSLVLRWKPSDAINIARYDVHCGGDDDSLGNETIIGSTRETTLADWGLKPGTAYTYRVVAVDSRGNMSAPVTLEARTADQDIQIVELKADEAGKDGRLVVTADGEGFVTLRPGSTGDPAKITFTLDIKEKTPFMLWCRYQPGYVKGKLLRVGIEIDGKPKGPWQMRAPFRPMWGTLNPVTKGKPITFEDKIVANGDDVFTLEPGSHTITITLDPKLDKKQHAIGAIWATNDHSWRPKGYAPQANFLKTMKRNF